MAALIILYEVTVALLIAIVFNGSAVKAVAGKDDHIHADGYPDYGNYPYGGTSSGQGYMDPYAFHQQWSARMLEPRPAQRNVFTSTYATGDAVAFADSSTSADDRRMAQWIGQARRLYETAHQHHNSMTTNASPDRSQDDGFAGASGAVGPDGFYQSAIIMPANPMMANVMDRYSPSSNDPNELFASSYSAGADQGHNGAAHRGAVTSVFDNNREITYQVLA